MRAVLSCLLLASLAGGCGAAPPPEARVERHQPSPVPPLAAPARPVATPRPPAACSGARACVERQARRAWLLRGSTVQAGPMPVSLGGPGHRTPGGTFAVAWKDEVHTSSEYGLPMPYSVFFAPGGIAFHEGDVTEPSHGCVHLRHADAAVVFAALQRGDAVRVL